MSDRTDKAHNALADALAINMPTDEGDRQYVLLRVAEVQAQIAQAEGIEEIMRRMHI